MADVPRITAQELVEAGVATGTDSGPLAARHKCLVIAYGVQESGRREVIGLDVGEAETEASWREFLRPWRSRGLRGVHLCVSDAHPAAEVRDCRRARLSVARVHCPFPPRHARPLRPRPAAHAVARSGGANGTPARGLLCRGSAVCLTLSLRSGVWDSRDLVLDVSKFSRFHPLDERAEPRNPGVYVLRAAGPDAAAELGLKPDDGDLPLYVGKAVGQGGIRGRLDRHRTGYADGYSPGLYLQWHLGEALGVLPRAWDLFPSTHPEALPDAIKKPLREARARWMRANLAVSWLETSIAETHGLEIAARRTFSPLLNPEPDDWTREALKIPVGEAPLTLLEQRDFLVDIGMHEFLTDAAYWSASARGLALYVQAAGPEAGGFEQALRGHEYEWLELPLLGPRLEWHPDLVFFLRADERGRVEDLIRRIAPPSPVAALIDAVRLMGPEERLSVALYEATRDALIAQGPPAGSSPEIEISVPLS